MGTMLVAFHSAGQPGGDMSQPVARLSGAKTERVNTSATSAPTLTAAATGGNPAAETSRKSDGGFVTVVALGANLFIVAGASPSASYPAAGASLSGFPLMSGQAITFAVNKGDKVAAVEFT